MNSADIMKLDNRKLMSLVSVSAMLNSKLDIHQLLPLIMLVAKDILEAEASSLFLLEPKANHLYCEVAMGEKGEIVRQFLRLELGQGIAGWVAKEKKPLLIEDAYKDNRFNPEADKKSGFRTRSLICIPVFKKEKLIGTLEVLNKTENRIFDDKDMALLNSLGEIAAVAIENAYLAENLRKRILELSLLYEFEKQISENSSISELGNWVLRKCLEFLEARAGTVYIPDFENKELRVLVAQGISKEAASEIRVKFGEGISGWVAQEKKSLLVQNLENDPRYNKTNKYRFETNSLISSPMLNQGELIGVISINNKNSGFAFTSSDLDLLDAIANRLAMTISNARLFEKVNRSAEDRVRARKLMNQIIPQHPPQIKGYDFGMHYYPMDDVGGDFFRIIPIDTDHTGIIIADVTGHGFPAAMLAMMGHSILSTMEIDLLAKPGKLFFELNQSLSKIMSGNFMTAFYAVLEHSTGNLTFANAGHRHPLLLRKSSKVIEYLKASGKLLGIFPDLIYEEQSIKLEKGDRLVLYTDGIVEVTDIDHKRTFHDGLLESLILEHRKDSASNLCAEIIREIQSFCKRQDFDDDATLLILDKI